MLLINDLRNYVTSLKDFFVEIEEAKIVIDDSQLTKFLSERKDDGKFILIGIIPKHNPKGNIDSVQSVNRTTFLILKKIDRASQTHDDFLDAFAEAQELARRVVLKMGADHVSGDCGVMTFLDFDSLDLDAIWALSSCDGYKIDFSTKNNF